MRKLVKAAAALTAGCMLLSTSAFAAVECAELAAGIQLDGGVAEFTVDYTTTGQSTILVLPTGVTPSEATDQNILYIGQEAIEDGSVDYTVNLGTAFDGSADVWVGGTGETTATKLGTLSAAPAAPARDFITSADTDKGTIKVNVASVSHDSMGVAKGNAIVALALDTTKYPNAGGVEAGYVVSVVDANGNAIDGAIVYYSAERARYIALIPTSVADYKFEVLNSGTANEVIVKYANINEDAKGTINALDFAQLKNMVKMAPNSVALSNAKKALIADVTGDGKVNALDAAQIKKAVKNTDYTIAVITNSKFN